MNNFVFFIMSILPLYIHVMETYIKMPPQYILQTMFINTSLPYYASSEEVQQFYNLAEKDIDVKRVLNLLQKFYEHFTWSHITEKGQQGADAKELEIYISMEYATFAKAIFTKAPNYWDSIKEQFEHEIHNQGNRDFKF